MPRTTKVAETKQTDQQTDQEAQQEPQEAQQEAQQGINPMEAAGQHETTEDSLVPPGAAPYYPGQPAEAPEVQVERLEAFLADYFPGEVGRTNYQVPETPVATAIRLLAGMHAQVALANREARCPEAFCNKPLDHRDTHGWVHFG